MKPVFGATRSPAYRLPPRLGWLVCLRFERVLALFAVLDEIKRIAKGIGQIDHPPPIVLGQLPNDGGSSLQCYCDRLLKIIGVEALGNTFCIDDFGTYSSLSCLKELPASEIKIFG